MRLSALRAGDRARVSELLVATCAFSSEEVGVALELFGVFAPTYRFIDGMLVLSSPNVTFSAVPVQIAFVVLLFSLVTVVALLSRTMALRQRDATRKLELQAWHLRQLVPGGAAYTIQTNSSAGWGSDYTTAVKSDPNAQVAGLAWTPFYQPEAMPLSKRLGARYAAPGAARRAVTAAGLRGSRVRVSSRPSWFSSEP